MVIRGFPARMLEVEIGGIAEAVANLTERGAVHPVAKATLTLLDSRFVPVNDAVVYEEIKNESPHPRNARWVREWRRLKGCQVGA